MMRKDILLSIFYCESLLHILTLYEVNVILLIYAHVNFTKGGDWVMENQIEPNDFESLDKKKCRPNLAATLQLGGLITAIGGGIVSFTCKCLALTASIVCGTGV